MSEDYDDVTYGPITFERAKHHCKCLAVDCDWRASEVDEYVNAQAKIIAVLRAEVKAWRHHDDVHECNPVSEWLMRQSIAAHNRACEAAQATDVAGALKDK